MRIVGRQSEEINMYDKSKIFTYICNEKSRKNGKRSLKDEKPVTQTCPNRLMDKLLQKIALLTLLQL